MTNAPERIWIEDEFGDGDEDQWTYGTWDVRNYRGYVVEYVRADLTLPAVQPDTRIKEYEEAYQYALHLAEALRENYPPNPDFQFLGDLVGLLTQIDNMVAGLSQTDAREAALRDIARQKKSDEMDTEYDAEYAEFEGGYNAIIDVARRALPAVQPGHVNETPKSEHDERVMLTPAAKGGDV